MVSFFFEEGIFVAYVEKVGGHQQHLRKLQSELPEDRFKIVATVGIHQQEFVDALSVQHLDDIVQNCLLSTGVEIDVQQNIILPCIHPERNGGKHYCLCSLFPCQPCSFCSKSLSLNIVRSIRHVVVMRLGGSPWKDGYLNLQVFNGFPVGLC